MKLTPTQIVDLIIGVVLIVFIGVVTFLGWWKV
jgi:hypothetical protein